MSRTYAIACKNCEQYLWIGQGWPKTHGAYIYRSEAEVKKLSDFLFDHLGHDLVFDDEEKLDLDDYRDMGEVETD